jgi:hypothetical protein
MLLKVKLLSRQKVNSRYTSGKRRPNGRLFLCGYVFNEIVLISDQTDSWSAQKSNGVRWIAPDGAYDVG